MRQIAGDDNQQLSGRRVAGRAKALRWVVGVTASLASIIAIITGVRHVSGDPTPNNAASNNLNSSVIQGVQGSVNQTTNYYSPPLPGPGSREAAVKDIRDRGLAFTVAGFEEVADSDNIESIELYLKAGMSPNSIGFSTSLFVLSEAIANNPGDKEALVDVFKKYGLNFKTLNFKGHLTYVTGEPALEDETIQYAMLHHDSDLIRHLVRVGADPSRVVKSYEEACRQAIVGVQQTKAQMRQMFGAGRENIGDNLGSAERWVGYVMRDVGELRSGGVQVAGCPSDNTDRSSRQAP